MSVHQPVKNALTENNPKAVSKEIVEKKKRKFEKWIVLRKKCPNSQVNEDNNKESVMLGKEHQEKTRPNYGEEKDSSNSSMEFIDEKTGEIWGKEVLE
jgi:hypothetical protein